MHQTTDQSPRVIVRALQTPAPGQTIAATRCPVPITTELCQPQQGKIELARQCHKRRNDPSKATVGTRLSKHENRNTPGGQSLQPAALTTLIDCRITAHPQQSHPVWFRGTCGEAFKQRVRCKTTALLHNSCTQTGCHGSTGS